MRALQTDLKGLVERAPTHVAFWALLIQSLDSGEVLFSSNAANPVMPASNMKIVTLAVAAEQLGWNYAYETKLVTSAPIEDGTLKGDLVIVGSGDPSISWRNDAASTLLDSWVRQVQAAGIRRVEGRLIGDDRAFDRDGLGAGWAWDDLAYTFAAPVSALEYNEDVAEAVFRPGGAVGAALQIDVVLPYSGLTLRNLAVTGAAGSDPTLDVVRDPGSGTVKVTGSIPLNGSDIRRRIPVVKPAEYFAGAVRASLVANGIGVAGSAVGVDDAVPPLLQGPDVRVLATYTSPPLSEIATLLMKISHNLYADTLLKTIGRGAGKGTAAAGTDVVRTVLDTWGIARDRYVAVDGSGLSRYNYLTPELLVAILTRMQRDPRHAPFMSTLPIAGTDGTLANRMKGTKAEGNARAKTGSLSNARALSGYVRTLDGESLVFSIIANNFIVPPSQIEHTIDLMVDRLANFTRK